MAPKTAEKKVASKAVTKKAGKKGGKKKGVESWKIYIYKVRLEAPPVRPCDLACTSTLLRSVVLCHCITRNVSPRRS